MSILPIVVEYLKILKQMLMLIFSVIMVTLILQANKNKCTWVNEESWETMKNCFPDAKQKNAQIEV